MTPTVTPTVAPPVTPTDDPSVTPDPTPTVIIEGTDGPIVIIPTMGEWGIIIAVILLGFAAVLRFRDRDSEV